MMLYRYLRAAGPDRAHHRVISILSEGQVADRIRELGVQVDSLDANSPAAMPLRLGRLRQLLAAARVDLLHGWMYHGALAGTMALGRRSRTRQIWAIHHSLSDPGHEKPMTQLVLRLLRRFGDRADAITYCSRISRAQHRDWGLPASRDRLIPNAIDTDEFLPDPAAAARLRAEARIPEGRLIIGTVARAHPMKDHATFARAIAVLAQRGLDVHGVVIGQGQPQGAAVAAAAEAGIADRLTALPARSDIASLVPGFDLYILSSAWGEALPLAVAEAMSSGVLAAVTDVGDAAWQVGDCGASCPPRQPQALADAAARLLALPPPERARLAIRARQRIVQEMSLTAYVAAHDRLYRETLSRGLEYAA